jgi:diaminohydroxyphosphoribosylaminopyrimidine deaminase/5-amino-6-(5-phosphoribosylamino)uracil reductase
MAVALSQARAALGRTFPNPPVGAVVFRGDRVLGRGRTRPVGGPHAEIVALESARRRVGDRGLRGAAMAVTLEPCSHTGRTGPCTERLLTAGLRRVFVGHVDPHPEVAGRGVRRLRRAGVEVRVGVLEAACREQHRGFLSVVERGRPFVTLKLAASLDGRIATSAGQSRWITGPAARAAVHRLRARTDAILVGSGTALADDPELTARRGDRVVHRPVRVVVDGRLRVPTGARMYLGEAARTWVLCARTAPAARRRAVESTGAVLIDVPSKGRLLDVRRGLARLAEAGLTQVLVEGGGRLAASLLREDLVDEVHWFVAPKLLGGDGISALGALGLRALSDACALEDLRVRRVGSDVHVFGRVARRAGSASGR